MYTREKFNAELVAIFKFNCYPEEYSLDDVEAGRAPDCHGTGSMYFSERCNYCPYCDGCVS